MFSRVSSTTTTRTTSLLLTLFLAGSLPVQSQGTDCDVVLSVFVAMGGDTEGLTNGCLLPGVDSSSSKAVTGLDWRSMGLENALPLNLGKLTRLETLVLQNNALNGSIPKWISNLTSLTYLDLSENQFSGPIPSEIGKLGKLTYLSAHTNKLSGPIPPSIGNLSQLIELHLYQNSLTSVVPAEIGSLKKLKVLSLQQNKITGSTSGLTQLNSTMTILFPNPISSLPLNVFSETPAALLSPTNWTNYLFLTSLLSSQTPVQKRQLTTKVFAYTLYDTCPLNNVFSSSIPASCISGIYNLYCRNLSQLSQCHSAYNTILSRSYFAPLAVCAAWRNGPRSTACSLAVSQFRVILPLLVLDKSHATSFRDSVFASRVYAPCVTTSTVRCQW